MYREDKAQHVKRFLERYAVQSKSPWNGKPLRLLPYQWDEIISPLFGEYRDDAPHLRKYNRAGIWIPKKNGKSTLLSGLALWLLQETPGAEVVIVASTIAQAGIIYNEAANMVDLGPLREIPCEGAKYDKRFWVRRNIKAIEDQKTKGVLRVISADPHAVHGLNCHVLLDELAAWPEYNARAVWDALYNAGAARENPLHISISTAQFERGLGYEQFTYANKVKNGTIIDPHFLPVIYSASPDDDWRNEKTWQRVNPAYGTTVSEQSFTYDYNAAINNPLDENRFRVLRLNTWLSDSENWIPSEIFQQGYTTNPESYYHGRECYSALDLSTKWDATALVHCFLIDGNYHFVARYFLPRPTAEKREREWNIPFREYERLGHITLTSGEMIDYPTVKTQIENDAKLFRMRELRYDKNGNADILCRHELAHLTTVALSPHFSTIGPPLKHYEKLCKERRVRWNNPLLAWNLSNCKLKWNIDRSQAMIEKQNDKHIDGTFSSIVALSGALAAEDCVYTRRGLITL